VNALGAGAPDGEVDPPDQARLGQLVEEQAALRRVATLVARGAAADQLFAAVTGEVGHLLGAHLAGMGRYDSDTVTMLATWGAEGEEHPLVPGPWPLEGDDLASIVFRTGESVRIDDYHGFPGPIAAFVREELGVGASVASPIVVEGRLWGVLFLHSKQTRRPFPRDAESRLTGFTELVATAIANTESRAALVRLAEEQAALQRVATLVARGALPAEVFTSVAGEAGRVLSTETAHLGRYEPDRTVTFVAAWGTAPGVQRVGSRLRLGGKNVTTLVFDTGRPARVDGYADASGQAGAYARERGVRCSVGTPVIVEGRLWGIVIVGMESGEQPLSPDAEARLASFTELVATAVANAESRAALARLAEEQAALRRVATLVARATPQQEVFAAVAEEAGRLFLVDGANLYRYEPDGMATIVASAGGLFVVGSRIAIEGNNSTTLVYQTGRAARTESFDDTSGPLGAEARKRGIRSSVGTPVMVEGRLWGALAVGTSTEQPLPPDTEVRLASFAELVATAIANTESRSELAASRRRIVAAADEARRRIERDLHDGTQQRLVSLGLAVRAAEASVPAVQDDLRAELSGIAAGLSDAVEELQELSRGIHPAVLSERGLGSALRALARRCAVPVELEVATDARFPEPVEIAAYYVTSEALANVLKHARAAQVEISLAARNGSLLLSVRDDGVGGADPARGSGLAGLADRVEALGGSIRVRSADGAGTHITVDLPREYELAQGAG
jgi:signal transduction histidine kinase